MREKNNKFILLSLLLYLLPLLLPLHSQAAAFPLSIGISPWFQFPPKDVTVAGLRLSLLWGRHENVYGFDFGLLGNITEKELVGTSMSLLFNKADNATILGAQLTFGANLTKDNLNVVGIQLAGLANSCGGKGRVLGLQMAFIGNFNSKVDIYGAQVGAVNQADRVVGLQIGSVNQAEHAVGVQLGFMNRAKDLHGLQIGLLNFHTNGMLSFFPFLNAGF